MEGESSGMAKETAKEGEFAPGCSTVIDFSDKTCRAMMTAIKGFQKLPPAGSPIWDLRKSYPEFNRGLKGYRNRIVANMTKILQHAKIPVGDFKRRDVDEKFDFLVEVNDDLLERIGTSLDQEEGLFKRAEILVVNPGAVGSNPPGVWKEKKLERLNAGPVYEESETSTTGKGVASTRKIKRAVFRHGRVKVKPQEQFPSPIDNSVTPFVPKLAEKPHSLKPLSILPEFSENNQEFYGHPYEVELNHWQPSGNMLELAKPQYPVPIEKTPLVMVNTSQEVDKLVEELSSEKEIAVDLEHHSYRSYQGFTCLIQISTRTKDYVIDGLALRDELHKLNHVFANPKILKVLHAAQMDILWLQKDFSVYVVGMFDTSVAAKLLEFPQLSYQYLLSEICKTSTDKTYQLADWRLRPLPNDMVEYARKDTHYLLYMYDVLKNRLLESNQSSMDLLVMAYNQSRLFCLKRYEKPMYNPQVAIRKCKKSFNNRQLHGFVELFKWRDTIAREFDESLGFVLPNHMLQTIAETLPKEMTGVLACCDPVPMLVNQHLAVVHQIITEARELPLHNQEASVQQKTHRKVKGSNWLHILDSIHDYGASKGHSVAKLYECTEESVHESEWWSCVDASDMQVKQGPRIKFNGTISGTPSPTSSAKINELKFSPYQRYKITHEIVQQLRDPEKKTEVNMSDPMVKSVVETMYVTSADVEIIEEEAEAQPKPARRSTLMDQDFVPFNPMSYTGEKNNRGRKRKHEEEEVEDGEEIEAENGLESVPGMASFLAGAEISEDDESEQEIARPFVKVSQEPTGSKSTKKRKRKNLLKRLANRGKKRKYDVTESKEEPEDGEVVEDEDDTLRSDARNLPKTHSRASPHPTGANRWNRKSPDSRSQPDKGSNSKSNLKSKKGWFRGMKEGKSLTFKR